MNGLICSVMLAANAAGMAPLPDQWTANYAEALQAARLQQRPLLVILEDPSDPERRIDKLQSGDDSELGDLLSRYELCRVDVTTEYGQKVADVYDATEYPCTVITDQSCRLIMFRGFGKFTSEMWTSTLEYYAREDHGRRTRQYRHVPVRTGLFAHQGLDAARSAARRANRPLLVFVTMPGCHFCDKMKAETYSDNRVKEVLTSQFETVIVDQTDEPDWVFEQGVQIFPTTLLFSPRGDAASRIDGFVSPTELRSRLQNVGRQFIGRK